MAPAMLVGGPMIARSKLIAPVVAGLALVLLGVGVAVDIALRLSTDRVVMSWELVQDTSLTLALCAAGGWLMRDRAARPVGSVLLVSGLTGAVMAFLDAFGDAAILADSPGQLPLKFSAEILWPIFVTPMLTFLPLIFPTGRLLSPRWRILRWTAMASIIVLMAATATTEIIPTGDIGVRLANPLFSAAVSPVLVQVGSTLLFVSACGGLLALVVRWARGTRVIRQQVSMLIVGLSGYLLFQAAYPVMHPDLYQLGMTVCPLVLIAGIAVAVRRYDLYDIRPVFVRRLVIYATLTMLLTVLFVGVYFLASAVAAQLPIAPSPWSAAVAGGVAVVLTAEPGRRRLQRVLEQRFFGDRRRPLVAMARLRESTLGADDREVLGAIVATVAGSVRSPGAMLDLREDGHLRTRADIGAESAHPLVLPLLYRGERLGELRVSLRSPSEEFHPRDLALLEQLADQSAAIVYGLRRDAELAMARQEAITVAAEERAQLGRDLHDGLAPLLAGAGLAAEALRRGLEPGSPDELDAGRLADRLRTAAGEARRFAHDLQPAPLADTGLVAAVTDHVASLRGPDIPNFDVRADTGALPAALEQAAYFFVLEAVANTLRHSRADEVTIMLERDADLLTVSVEDNGIGLEAPYVSGVGLTSMRRRVQALDGSFDIGCGANRGTRVRARIPVPA